MDPISIRELLSYETNEKGKYGAPEGADCYDDCVVADAIGVLAHYDRDMAPNFFRAKERAERLAQEEKLPEQDRAIWDSIAKKKARDHKRNRATAAPQPDDAEWQPRLRSRA